MSQIDRSLAEAARAWPFEEARKLVARAGGKAPAKGYVLFETGYGPSGLPHIGTFGEVVRTTMVRQAFRRLSDIPTRLFCFSDDMDGLRKVPDNVPNKEMLAAHLGKPLTSVPDPFSNEHPSFGAANNARLRAFLDSFGFEYEFQSATDWYKSGRFDKMLLAMLQHYDEVQAVMLPTLGEERQRDLLALPADLAQDRPRAAGAGDQDATPQAGTIVYRDEDGTLVETPVTGGNVKLQWKADWAGRWFALDVDYEMYGKDLIPSAELRAKIVRILGGDAAGRLQLRAVPRRAGQEDLQVQGQRPVGRGMAALCAARKPVALHVAAAAPGEAALFRRHPARGRRLSRGASRSCRARSRPRRWRTRPGTSMTARRRPTARPASISACCSTSRAWRTPRARTCCGSTCAATCRAPRRRPRPISTGCCRARWPTTRTS